MALRLHAITVVDAHRGLGADMPTPGNGEARVSLAQAGSGAGGGGGGPILDGTEIAATLIPFRDLCAVVSEQKNFALEDPAEGAGQVARHRSVVDAVFRRAAVLPAPVGVVFRTPEVLKRWMELHYVSLSDALEFVEDRAVARVHIVRADGKRDELETGSDLAAAAAEGFRALRRRSVASVPLTLEQVTGIVLSASFLIERDLWNDFLTAVEEQRETQKVLEYEVTGPWAPYDFVRMQFGG